MLAVPERLQTQMDCQVRGKARGGTREKQRSKIPSLFLQGRDQSEDIVFVAGVQTLTFSNPLGILTEFFPDVLQQHQGRLWLLLQLVPASPARFHRSELVEGLVSIHCAPSSDSSTASMHKPPPPPGRGVKFESTRS